MTQRVVVTGLGIVSSLGNNASEVTDSLRNGKSGITYNATQEEIGMRSWVSGKPDIDLSEHIDRKQWRFMGDAAGYAFLSMEQAIADSGLTPEQVSNVRTGIIAGSGGAPRPAKLKPPIFSASAACVAWVLTVSHRPWVVPCPLVWQRLSKSKGLTTPSHQPARRVRTASVMRWSRFNSANRTLSLRAAGRTRLVVELPLRCHGCAVDKYNETPIAHRAYDADRDGFVIAGGGGMLVLESLEHAQARGAKIYAELVGYGATSDGHDMVAPSGEGAVRCMQQAMATVDGDIDYINAHGTSTPAGDIQELKAVREVFGDSTPAIASTKSLSGHSLGAAGVQEAIYSLLMMENDFIAASANVESLDEGADGMDVVQEARSDVRLNRVMSNSFGFGGTNATLVFQRFEG